MGSLRRKIVQKFKEIDSSNAQDKGIGRQVYTMHQRYLEKII